MDSEEHGEHVFVQGFVTTDEDRPVWAFRCHLHDIYGTVRLDYSEAVQDGHEHAET